MVKDHLVSCPRCAEVQKGPKLACVSPSCILAHSDPMSKPITLFFRTTSFALLGRARPGGECSSSRVVVRRRGLEGGLRGKKKGP
jgi:hypothetical protein